MSDYMYIQNTSRRGSEDKHFWKIQKDRKTSSERWRLGNHYLFEHRHIFVLVPIQNLYFQRYMVYSFLCSVIAVFTM
jgi:hypothetical protein